MILKRMNLEAHYYTDMITHNGFRIENEDPYSPTDPNLLVNSSEVGAVGRRWYWFHLRP